ncbi:MAG: hypothetical protein H6Q51_2255, partial [Deltaproteobacteria bacterium]|nr:hypothetical protein [Deltaproteobacteria bacterium]
LDYHVEAKEFDGWVMLKASKQKK